MAVDIFDSAGKPLGLQQLKQQVQAALDAASLGYLDDQSIGAGDAHSNVSLLTALGRDDWASERDRLQQVRWRRVTARGGGV